MLGLLATIKDATGRRSCRLPINKNSILSVPTELEFGFRSLRSPLSLGQINASNVSVGLAPKQLLEVITLSLSPDVRAFSQSISTVGLAFAISLKRP
jgi:hypothetical protein